MPKLTVDVPHNLGQEEASRRLKDKMGSVREMFGDQVNDLQEEWRDDQLWFSFRVVGMSVSGVVAVEPTRVTVDADLPLAAAMFRGTIEQRVRDEIAGVLA